MATKAEVLAQLAEGEGCLGKAADDEEIFILRAQDKLAPIFVRNWASTAAQHGCPAEKVQEAIQCANRMEAWDQAHPDTAKFPD